MPTAMAEFRKMVERHTFGLTWTQQPRNFTDEYLEKFDVIVFLHARGFGLNKEQMDSFKKFIRAGGSFWAYMEHQQIDDRKIGSSNWWAGLLKITQKSKRPF